MSELIEYLQTETEDTKFYRKRNVVKFTNKPDQSNNIKFFRNEISISKSNAVDTYEGILKNWRGDFDKLEREHGFVQWLFPIYQKSDFNANSQSLQLHELIEISKMNKAGKIALRKNLDLMLEFYGMEFDGEGKLVRTRCYLSRFNNLIRNKHNFLRITRILKFLGDFEMIAEQEAIVEFLYREIFIERSLKPLAATFCLYWVHTIKSEQTRMKIIQTTVETINNS